MKEQKINLNMKGVVLAGGRATRLHPLTLVTNKHLLPLYNKPIIYHVIEKIVNMGISKIMIVTSPGHVDDFVSLLGSGDNFILPDTGQQLQIVYGIQNEPNGIAQGLWIAKDYVGKDNCMLYLGDNIFEDDLSDFVSNFKEGANIFLKSVDNPKDFGIAELDSNGNVINTQEKPEYPKSDLAVTGFYLYDNTVFSKFEGIEKSERGEYEISYINNKYIKEGKMKANIIKKSWFDTGTFNGLNEATNYMRKKYNDLGEI